LAHHKPTDKQTYVISLKWKTSDGSRIKIFYPGPGRVSQFEFGKFPLKMSNFSIISPSDQKVSGSKPGQPLIYCESGPISRKKQFLHELQFYHEFDNLERGFNMESSYLRISEDIFPNHFFSSICFSSPIFVEWNLTNYPLLSCIVCEFKAWLLVILNQSGLSDNITTAPLLLLLQLCMLYCTDVQ